MVWLSSNCIRCWSPPSHSLGEGRSASGHSCYGGAGVRGSYTRKAECSNGEEESFALPNFGINSLVSLLLSCTYFKHYFRLSLNVKCLLAKFLKSAFLYPLVCPYPYVILAIKLLALAYLDLLVGRLKFLKDCSLVC